MRAAVADEETMYMREKEADILWVVCRLYVWERRLACARGALRAVWETMWL